MASGRPPKLTAYDGNISNQTKADKENTEKQLFSYKDLNSNPPDYLKGEALKEWTHIVPLLKKDSPISELDRGMIVAYCNTYGLMVDCQNALNESGTFDSNGKKSPYLVTQQQATRDLKSYATALGLTLESRSKLEYTKAKNAEPDDPYSDMLESI
ncbi:phage terminase small subunit P27 family [Companilactobacillus hulinensis]|uniref:phage terminase small subunit P27 family n=1 Tax=Companilactobacillus hulinensis TaxID=2486007 RepID=UPI000F766093|nr:phage terminase small subunit P27 family [Companilactobacillus hulinensis]